MARLEPRDHTISLAIAAEYTKRHRSSALELASASRGGKSASAPNAHAFHADQVMKLLQQPGCKALRIYHGRSAKNEQGMILVGVDENGNDMTSGIMMQLDFPCPPFCPVGSPLDT